MLKPSYGKKTSTSSSQNSPRAFSDSTTTCWPWRARLVQLVLVVAPDHAGGRGVDDDGILRDPLRALGRRQHERVGAVDRDVHVEHAERIPDHARREIGLHRERRLHDGLGIARGVRPHVEGDAAEILAPRAELVDVAARPGRVGRRRIDRLGHRRLRRAPAHHDITPERILGGGARVPGEPREGVVEEHALALPAPDRRHRVDQAEHRDRHRTRVMGHVRQLEQRRHLVRGRRAGLEDADDPVDVRPSSCPRRGSPGSTPRRRARRASARRRRG